jgi:hypothetical protein
MMTGRVFNRAAALVYRVIPGFGPDTVIDALVAEQMSEEIR